MQRNSTYLIMAIFEMLVIGRQKRTRRPRRKEKRHDFKGMESFYQIVQVLV